MPVASPVLTLKREAFGCCGGFRCLVDDVELDLGDALANHSQRIGGGIGDVDNASGNVGPAVVDPNRHGSPGGDVGHAQFCAERQGRMRGGQFMRVELFAVRGPRSLAVEAGKSLRGDLGVRCIFVGRERRMLSHGRHTVVGPERCRSIVIHRRLSARAKKSGVFGDHGGLRAGGKRRRAEHCGKQSNDFPDTRGRARARVRNRACVTIDARGTGTANGRHIASPIRAPNQRPISTRHQGGLQSGRTGGRVGPGTRDFT
jgi:hypothetical protein